MAGRKRGVLDWYPDEFESQEAWVKWLKGYSPKAFLKVFLDVAQDAEGTCVNCYEKIYLDIIEGGGVPDWRTSDGDYGCARSPDSTHEEQGSHTPRKLA